MEKQVSVRVMQRKNTGNYEHMELEITDNFEGSMLTDGVKKTMSVVRDALYGTGSFSEGSVAQAAVVTSSTVKGPQVASLAKERKPAPEVKVEVKAEPEVKAEVKVEVKAEETKVEEVKAVEVKAAKKETVIVTKKTKLTSYDRAHDPHKQLIGQFLDSKFPGWKKPENLAKAGTASRTMHGKDFLDGEGQVLEAFKEEYSKFMVGLV